MGVRAVLAIGLTLLTIAVALVLSGSPARVAGTNSVLLQSRVAALDGYGGACQSREVLPAGTSAVRMDLDSAVGPTVTVTVFSGERVVTRGTRGSGWTGADVTVLVEHVRHTVSDTTVCLMLGPSRQRIDMLGRPGRASTVTTSAEEPAVGRMRIEYLAAGDRSWWSQILSIARRIGLGRAPSGTWIVLLIVALMAALATLASCLLVRELGASGRGGDRAARAPAERSARLARAVRRVPTAAWVCAVVACLNAVCWSILSPPFQTPDEPGHFAYVEQLAEAHRLPLGGTYEFSPQEEAVLDALHHGYIQFLPSAHTIASRAAERKLEDVLAHPRPGNGPGDAGTASDEPPLYYALETIPYELGSDGSLLDRLQLMRLLSCLCGALTALFAFLFVREALPGVRWAWTVGGLGVALAPLLGYMSGAVNPDAMLFAVSAALFYLLARGFRRGLTPRLGVAIGTVVGIGLVTKLNFLGLAPGAIVGLIALTIRAPSKDRRSACVALAIAIAIAASPMALYVGLKLLVHHESVSQVLTAVSGVVTGGSALGAISYTWQFYLPRLPGMTNYFPGIFTTRQLWFDGLVGLYGWADTVFPGWVDDLALVPAGLLALLWLRALVVGRTVLHGRAVELLVYAVMGLGVLVLVGVTSYSNDVVIHQGPFWEPRYLLPMLPLFGAALALAARGAGRRWGPAVGVLIVVLILGHDVFSQLQVISRYYG